MTILLANYIGAMHRFREHCEQTIKAKLLHETNYRLHTLVEEVPQKYTFLITSTRKCAAFLNTQVKGRFEGAPCEQYRILEHFSHSKRSRLLMSSRAPACYYHTRQYKQCYDSHVYIQVGSVAQGTQ
jgi:hypothetical protein